MIEAVDPNLIRSKHKAIAGLVPYAIRLGQGGQRGIVDVIVRASVASNSNFRTRIWRRVRPYFTTIFDESSPPSLNRTIVLISPYIPWGYEPYKKNAVTRWAAAVSVVPFAAEFSPSVVDTLLQIGNVESLQPHIPTEIMAWLKTRPSLPPVCRGREDEFWLGIFQRVRGLGDIEILKSYFLLIWSEWSYFFHYRIDEMEISVPERFGGIWMWGHRRDLVERLDYVLGQLDGIDEDSIQQRKKEQYGRLREVLLEADMRTMETLTRTPLKLILLGDCTDSVGAYRIPLNLHLCSAPSVICRWEGSTPPLRI